MEYLAHIVAFILAAFGIAGDTWDNRKRGLLKFTRAGWIIGTLALATLPLSTALAYRAEGKRINAQRQRDAVQSIARMEVCLATLRYKLVLDVLAHRANGTTTAFGSDIGLSFSDLRSPDVIDALKTYEFEYSDAARPNVGDARPLDQSLSEEIAEFIDLTDLALAKYSSFLDTELILVATQPASHNVTRRLLVTSEQFEQMRNRGVTRYPALWDHEFESYLEIVDLLQSTLEESGASQDVLACKPASAFDVGADA